MRMGPPLLLLRRVIRLRWRLFRFTTATATTVAAATVVRRSDTR